MFFTNLVNLVGLKWLMPWRKWPLMKFRSGPFSFNCVLSHFCFDKIPNIVLNVFSIAYIRVCEMGGTIRLYIFVNSIETIHFHAEGTRHYRIDKDSMEQLIKKWCTKIYVFAFSKVIDDLEYFLSLIFHLLSVPRSKRNLLELKCQLGLM